MVSMNDDGSLDTAQWNFTAQLMAIVDLVLWNHACGKSV
jgi:hypothetical protein